MEKYPKIKYRRGDFSYEKFHQILLFCSTFLITITAIVSIVSYGFIFHLAPLNGEDYALTANFKNINWGDRILWMFDRAVYQAQTWNARLGEMLAILWLGLPRILFTFVACLTFIVFSHLSGNLITVGRTLRIRTFLVLAVVYPLWPGMEVFFWRTVQAGYLQPLVLSIGCMYLYRNKEAINQIQNSSHRSVIASIVGLLAGLSFENTPVTLMIFVLASLILTRQRSVWSIRTLSPVVAIFIGWSILITAPSTTHRRQFYSNVLQVPEFGIDYLMQRVTNVLVVFWQTSATLIVITLVALLCLCITRRWGEASRALLLISTATLIIASVVAAPYTEPRSFALAWTLMLTVSVTGFHRLCEQSLYLRVLVAIAVLCGLASAQRAHEYYTDFARRIDQRDRTIATLSLTEACETGIVVEEVRTKYPYRYLNNRDEWVRGNPDFMSRYYGCLIHVE